MTQATPTTRLAPSPTGALHLGNARTFLINWAMARQAGWRIVLRVEDLDGPRIKAGASEQAIDILRWLGMDWDDGPFYQLHDCTPYRQALETLLEKKLIYPCSLTRSEIEKLASAPHAEDEALRYPGLRPKAIKADPKTLLRVDEHAWRVMIPPEPLHYKDAFAGPQMFDVQSEVGDFVVASKAGRPAYQLAVMVDDHRQGITHIVRGDDLLSSAARQLWLYHMLDYQPHPTYCHLPLIIGPDGHRLAKRHGDTTIDHYRQRGVPANRIIGLIASWCGIHDKPEPLSAEAFAQQFDLDKLSHEPVVFTDKDDAWLTA